jgi:riboflavin kinase / FMN adenylyltransferase
MKVYSSIEEFETIPFAVATTGTFDGVHIGHKTILNRLIEVAHKTGGESVLLTFNPHPRQVLQPDVDLKMLNTIEEKIDLLEKAGLDHLIIHPFTKDFSRTSTLEYVRNILVQKIGVKRLVIGYDHHFGRNREGSFDHLKEFGPLYGFEVEEIPAMDIDAVAVSSTKVRKAIEVGDVERANEFLGYPYTLKGIVAKGDQLGRTIGFPTANLEVSNSSKLLPANGVFAVMVTIDNQLYKGMCNIGVRPTIEGTSSRIEINLFDFDADVYGKPMRVQFLHRMRSEQKFANLNELKSQLSIDSAEARNLLNLP